MNKNVTFTINSGMLLALVFGVYCAFTKSIELSLLAALSVVWILAVLGKVREHHEKADDSLKNMLKNYFNIDRF